MRTFELRMYAPRTKEALDFRAEAGVREWDCRSICSLSAP
jgi:hypothetical protein